jgi:lipopolysaccharide transport system permease protein
MSAARDSPGTTSLPLVLRRPALWLSIPLDACLAALAYLAAYWLRFHSDRLDVFLPVARSTVPLVVATQLIALSVSGAYARLPGLDWLTRVVAGVGVGSAAAVMLLALSTGLEGVSRGAFIADAILLSLAAVGWRGIWVLYGRARRRGNPEVPAGLIDRTAEMTTLRSVVMSVYGYRELLRNLVLKDIKLKYRGSVFGFLWSLANPLLMIVVYTVAFTYILRIRSEGFVFCLMLGLLSWTFFATSAGMATGAVVENAGLLKSVLFPRAILPIATVLFNLAQYLLTISVFLPVMLLLYRVPPSAPMVLFPLFLALQVIFTVGVALTLATATAFFRDVRHLLEVALAVLFWTTPIVYELHNVPERFQLLILMSPMSSFVVAYQEIFFYRSFPDATVWLVASAHALGAFVLGTMLFLAFEDRFMEQL